MTLLEGGLAAKWTQLRGDPLFWIFQAFFWIVPFSLLWTEDTQSGLKMAGRYGFFLLSPLYLTVARRELAPRCIAVFLAGCAMSEALAYYNCTFTIQCFSIDSRFGNLITPRRTSRFKCVEIGSMA